MQECNEKNVPVFVDCAWFGTCHGIEVDLDQPCIKMVGFSTGKGLVTVIGAGIVFTDFTEEECYGFTDRVETWYPPKCKC